MTRSAENMSNWRDLTSSQCRSYNRAVAVTDWSSFLSDNSEEGGLCLDFMKAQDVTVEWLQGITYQVKYKNPTIEGVLVRPLIVHVDGRGDLTELWSKPWLPSGLVDVMHVYQSATDYGVVKSWHLHGQHTDQLAVTRGKLQLTLVDIREESPSFGHANVFIVGEMNPCLVKIPPMVLHGWKALSMPQVLVTNFMSDVYRPEDELKFPWNCVLADVWEPKNG